MKDKGGFCLEALHKIKVKRSLNLIKISRLPFNKNTVKKIFECLQDKPFMLKKTLILFYCF